MKKRHIAGSVLVIGVVWYFAHPLSRSSLGSSTGSNGWASSASTRAMTPSSDSSRNQATSPAKFPMPLPSRAVAAVSPTLGTAANANSSESAALDRLQKNSVRPWALRRDDFTGVVRTLQDGQINVASSAVTNRESANEFVNSYAQDLFGVDPARVQFAKEETTDRTRVTYQEVVNGSPVFGATLNLFYENGALTRVQNDMPQAEPDLSAPPSSFTLAQAVDQYKAAVGSGTDVALSANAQPQTILYAQGNKLLYAYEFVTDETSKASGTSNTYRILFEAETPHVIKRSSTRIQ